MPRMWFLTNQLIPSATQSPKTPARDDCGAYLGTDDESSEMKTPLLETCEYFVLLSSSTKHVPTTFPLLSFPTSHNFLTSTLFLKRLLPYHNPFNNSQTDHQNHHLHHAIGQICHRRSRLHGLEHGLTNRTSPFSHSPHPSTLNHPFNSLITISLG